MEDFRQLTRSVLGLQLTNSQLKSLELFERELLEWNTRLNLTAIRDPQQVRIKHFLDSLTCLSVMRDQAMNSLVDIGTGAGFPGIPIKIIHPDICLTLVESVSKKTRFCQHVVQTLNLDKVEILSQRAELVGHLPTHRQQYDWAVARAVAHLPVLMEYLLPLVRIGGAALAMKGESGPVEAHESEHAISLLGGRLRRLIPVTLPGVVEERYLIVIDKVAATPEAYPRHVGLPAKHPLQKR